jgi:hypothetical protein
LDILAFNIAEMTDWLSIILNPARIGIPLEDFNKFQIFAMIACDYIWFSRNKAHHEDLVSDALAISAHINKLVQEHLLAWNSSLPRILEVWQKPRFPYIKINYDTAIRDSFSVQAAVIRNSSGTITHCSSLISPPCTAVIGEALAALLATKLAISIHATSFILEGDSTTVTLALQNPLISKDWHIAATISQIHSLIPSTTSWSASYVNRSTNFCALMWQNEPQPDFFLAAFPYLLFPLDLFPPVLGKFHPVLF